MKNLWTRVIAAMLVIAMAIGFAGCASSAGQEITLATVEGTIGTEPEETVSSETVSNEAEDILVQVSSKEAVETTEPSVEGTQPSNGTDKAVGISNGNTGDSKSGGTNTAKTTEPTPATKPTEPASTTKPTEPSATEPTPTTKPMEPKATEPAPTTKPTEPAPTTKPTEPTPTTKPTEPTPTTKPTEPAPAVHTHSWDGGTVTKAATCTATGIMTYTCTECGDTYTESIPATDHTWVHYHEDAQGYGEVGVRCQCGWTCWQSDADAAGLATAAQYHYLFHVKQIVDQLGSSEGHSYVGISRDIITKEAVDYDYCSVCGATK